MLGQSDRGAARNLASLRRPSLGSFVIIGQVALSLVLLAGAGLMVRSFQRLSRVELGFEPAGVLTFRVNPPPDTVRSSIRVERILEQLAAIPGADAVAAKVCAPLTGRCNGSIVSAIAGRPAPAGATRSVGVHYVSPDYLRANRIPILRGRVFTDADRTDSPRVALLSETAAARLFPGQDPVGQRVRLAIGYFSRDPEEYADVIGVVGDVPYGRLENGVRSEVYVPAFAFSSAGATYFVRTAGDPLSLVPQARRAVLAFDPGLPIHDVRTLDDRVQDALSRMRFGTLLLTLFAMVALSMAALGIYAVTAYAVARRTREIGVRLAVGARSGDVLRLVLREGIALALVGACIGLPLALALSRALRGLLFGVEPTDLPTYVAVSSVIAGVALVSCYLPGRRAASVDPMEALRHE